MDFFFWLRFHTILSQPFVYSASNQNKPFWVCHDFFYAVTLGPTFPQHLAHLELVEVLNLFFQTPTTLSWRKYKSLMSIENAKCKGAFSLRKSGTFCHFFLGGKRKEKSPSFPLFSSQLTMTREVPFYPFISIGSKCEELSHFLHLKRCHFRWHPIVHFYLNDIWHVGDIFAKRKMRPLGIVHHLEEFRNAQKCRDSPTLFKNYSKCRISIFAIFHQFLSYLNFSLTSFVHSK